MIWITLTDEELAYADEVAAGRNACDRGYDYIATDNRLYAHKIGTRGELGFGKHIGKPRLKLFDTWGDDGVDFDYAGREIDVKARSMPADPRLLDAVDLMIPVSHGISDDLTYVLAIVAGDNGRRIGLAGWIGGYAFRNRAQRHDFGRGDTWYVGQRALRPVAALTVG